MGPYLQVGGQWFIRQNNGYVVELNVNQDKDQIGAFATHSNGRVKSTQATGHVTSSNFKLTITWNNGTEGEYTGEWKPNRTGMPGALPGGGYLEGNTRDLKNQGSQSGWRSDGKVIYIG